MPRSVLSRATDAVANRLDRRSFLSRSALVGTALVAAPTDLLLRPGSAYAAVCSCQGQGCACGSLCCDGYTEFCCAIYGANACPTGSLTGGWWKADGSSYCGGAARYYMDCHKPCGGCGCGGSGLCSGSCNGTHCGCGNGRCDHRKAGCTSFRYGNCSNNVACIGPIQCRVVTCTPPWQVEPSCSSSAVRTDNATRAHNRPCLQAAPPIYPFGGDWNGNRAAGLGFYDARTATWSIRQETGGPVLAPYVFGGDAADVPVVLDWDGDGSDEVGLFRNGSWYLTKAVGSRINARTFRFGTTGDRPVTGDWNGDGITSVGVWRKANWYLTDTVGASAANRSFRYGSETDHPITGDWNGSGVTGIGVFRGGYWYLRDTASPGAAQHTVAFGRKDDLPVTGDWFGLGATSIGVYRPTDGKWYLRRSRTDSATITVTWGQKWLKG